MEIVSAQSELELNLPTTNFVGLACTCSMYRLGNRKVGPFLTPPFENFTGSPLGVIPKKHSAPVKWRIIHDLSWPTGLSVNDGIPKDLFTCTCDSLDRAITPLKQFGTGALMLFFEIGDRFHTHIPS